MKIAKIIGNRRKSTKKPLKNHYVCNEKLTWAGKSMKSMKIIENRPKSPKMTRMPSTTSPSTKKTKKMTERDPVDALGKKPNPNHHENKPGTAKKIKKPLKDQKVHFSAPPRDPLHRPRHGHAFSARKRKTRQIRGNMRKYAEIDENQRINH